MRCLQRISVFYKPVQAGTPTVLNAKSKFGGDRAMRMTTAYIPAVDLPHRDDGSRLTAFDISANT